MNYIQPFLLFLIFIQVVSIPFHPSNQHPMHSSIPEEHRHFPKPDNICEKCHNHLIEEDGQLLLCKTLDHCIKHCDTPASDARKCNTEL